LTALIYRHDLLPYSETFVLEQTRHLKRYKPFFAGRRRVEGLELPSSRVAVASESGFLFPMTGKWPALIRRLQNENVKLVHAHFEGGGIGALGLARDLGVPLVTTCHGWDVTVRDEERWPNPVLRWLYQRSLKMLQKEGALFIAVSEHIRQKMLARGYPAERTVVHYIGVDCEEFQPDGPVDREPIVLFVGRLVEKKGCVHLIEAMQAHRHARLVIIGDGPLREQLAMTGAKFFPGAEFLGAQPREVVRSWMNRAKVLCVPTVKAANGDMDGCPFVFFEAQAMGLPVVSYDSGGSGEAVSHGETGLLAVEGDAQGLGELIGRLLHSTQEWKQMSLSARVRVRRNFDIVKQCEKLETIYDGLK
jgi:glycosyltransferase involved in cell wall biosynthesis